jgi:hypothetical protein
MDNPDVQKQFEDFFDLFSRPGWTLLVEDLESMIENLDSLEYVDSLEKLQYHKGQLTILRRIVGMKQAMEAAYEDLDEESDLR